MAENHAYIDAPPDAVYDVLADAPSYAHWVVGASEIRAVEGDWPEPGSKFHHTQGFFGVGLKDSTLSIAANRPRQLVIEVRFRPFMVGKVEFRLRPRGRGTHVTMVEYPIAGPIAKIRNPLIDRALWARNVETLRRLRKLAEQRADERAGPAPSRAPESVTA
ncbi:MAG TPA: SRPBCC family protein [Thermoleophilaceae bacterium]